MLTLQDCLDFCEVPEEIVDAIAEHDHMPTILAAELATCLTCAPGGLHVIHRYLCDNAAASMRCRDTCRRERVAAALNHFEKAHPELTTLA